MTRSKWTDLEINTLRSKYYSATKEYLITQIYNHSWEQIKIKASKLGFSRSNSAFRSTNIGNLLKDSHEAYYWTGFLLADGSFYNKRIKLTLRKEDANQVFKFAKFINATNNIHFYDSSVEVQAKDIDLVPLFCNKFNIKDRKTYNPPSEEILTKMNISLLTSLLVGYIDGDGNIRNQLDKNGKQRKGCTITIKVHSSWLNILKTLSKLFCGDNKYARINNDGYALWIISCLNVCIYLKKHAILNNLPILERKWNHIDESYISKSGKPCSLLQTLSKAKTNARTD